MTIIQRLEDRLDTRQYLNLLETLNSASNPGSHFSFLHDHFPVHNARVVREWFTTHSQFNVLPLPKMSGDLNPITDVWQLVLNELKPLVITNVTDLCEAVITAWHSTVTKELIESLALTMSYRFEAVLEAEGGPITISSIKLPNMQGQLNSMVGRCRAVIEAKEKPTRY